MRKVKVLIFLVLIPVLSFSQTNPASISNDNLHDVMVRTLYSAEVEFAIYQHSDNENNTLEFGKNGTGFTKSYDSLLKASVYQKPVVYPIASPESAITGRIVLQDLGNQYDYTLILDCGSSTAAHDTEKRLAALVTNYLRQSGEPMTPDGSSMHWKGVFYFSDRIVAIQTGVGIPGSGLESTIMLRIVGYKS
jgi:hypothetical protein